MDAIKNARKLKEQSFLAKYTDGEIDIFMNMVHKMVESKNYEIFKQSQIRKAMSEVSSESEMSAMAINVVDESSDDPEEVDSEGVPKKDVLPKLKPSGVVCQIVIDPDASSEEESIGKKKSKKLSSQDVLEQERVKREKQEAAKKKDKVKQMKEISKNFDRKDKRETHRFLMKHGLTLDEAKEYTQLGTEFDIKRLNNEEKSILENNFHAQVYAFRKLREKLLMADDPG